MVNERRLLRTFLGLVRIDSVSRREALIAGVLVKELKKLGLSVRKDKKGNVIALCPGDLKKAPMLLFNAHMDTVVPGLGVTPVVKKGVIYSDGSTVLGADDKAGIAAVLEMLAILKEKNIPHGPIKIIFTVEEEIGLKGARCLSQKDTQADLCFVLDAHGDVGTVITKSPAQDSIRAVIRGRAAHAGICPEHGINAIQIAARAVSAMKLGRIDAETTANIGIIEGGQATNIVPEEAVLRGEARSHSEKKLKAQVAAMVRCVEHAARQAGGHAQVTVQRSYNAISIPSSAPIVDLTRKVAKDLKLKHHILSSGGGSDANIIYSRGIPTVALGIGMEHVHSKQEYITVKNLVDTAHFIIGIVVAACR